MIYFFMKVCLALFQFLSPRHIDGQRERERERERETSQSQEEHSFANVPEAAVTLECKSKTVPLQPWSGPEGSRKLRFSDYVTMAQDGGKLSALRTGYFLPPGSTPGTHFC